MSHLIYWTLFGEFTREQIAESDREKIILALESLLMEMETVLRPLPRYSLFHRPLFLDAVTTTVQVSHLFL